MFVYTAFIVIGYLVVVYCRVGAGVYWFDCLIGSLWWALVVIVLFYRFGAGVVLDWCLFMVFWV